MKHRLPAILPSPRDRAAALWMAAIAVWACVGAAAPPAASVYGRRQPNAPTAGVPAQPDPPAAEVDAQAERIVATALAKLAEADSFAARLRHKVRVGDRVLVGTGRYLQAGRGEEQRYRFESSLTCDSSVCDTETFTLVEVCDGVFAWTHRHYGTDAPQLERLDVRRVRDRLTQFGAPDPATASAYLGGLQRSLGTLRQWFRFVSAVPGDLEGRAVWIVEGRWNPDWLRVILPDLGETVRRPGGIAPGELPDGVPWSVRFSIGSSDLVPYRVEWLAVPGPRPAATGRPEPIGVLDLQEVRLGGPVDAAAFMYKPAAEGLIDMTDAHLTGLSPLRR